MPGFAILPMGLATVLINGLNPEIMLAIDFRGRFCATFWKAKSGRNGSMHRPFERNEMESRNLNRLQALTLRPRN